MVQKGDILYSPLHRVTVTYLLTSADTAGTHLQVDVIAAPGGKRYSTLMHVHPKQSETLVIKSGTVWATINGKEKLYGPGDVISIPAGTPHKLENASVQEELNFICEITPALGTEVLFETALTLAQSGRLDPDEALPLLQTSLTLNKYANHFYLAAYPVWLQKILFKVLAPVALLLGHQAELNYKEAVSDSDSASLLYG